MPKKKPTKGKPEVHKDLEGFEITINEFGEIITSLKVERINEFLDENVEDKKLLERDEKLKKQWEAEQKKKKDEEKAEEDFLFEEEE